jgi:hypothetical protein
VTSIATSSLALWGVLELLGELNPDVSGDYDSTRDLVGYDLVVANELSMKECLELSRSADVA